MRRIEYNIKIMKNKKKEEQIEKGNKKERFNSIETSKNRNSCIEFGYFNKLVNKSKSKSKAKKEIIKYIFDNITNLKEDMPKEVKNYLIVLLPSLIKIQKRYKIHYNNIKKIIKIQANYRAHLYSNLYKDFLKRKEKTENFIYIIQKVLFLNLYHLKINPNHIHSSKKCFIKKIIYPIDSLYKIKFLQKEIKSFLSHRNLKRIYGKKKCVYVKPHIVKPLGKIRLIQRNVILFLDRLKRRHSIPKSQMIIKKVDFTNKVILIQRFAKTIHKDIIYPLIPKDTFNQNNIFIKSNRKYARKKTVFINTKIIPFNPKNAKMRIINKDSKITKLHKFLEKIIFIQKNIRIYLNRDDYDIYDYPKCEEYISKESFVLPKKDKILLLQRQVKYFLYREKVRDKTIKKCAVQPLKCTKTIRTNTEKIFSRLSKLRIMYDKNLILFIVKVIEVIQKYLGRISFNLIIEESKRQKLFSVKAGKFRNSFKKNKFTRPPILKVIEPEYKVQTSIKRNKNKNINYDKNNNSNENNNLDININSDKNNLSSTLNSFDLNLKNELNENKIRKKEEKKKYLIKGNIEDIKEEEKEEEREEENEKKKQEEKGDEKEEEEKEEEKEQNEQKEEKIERKKKKKKKMMIPKQI